MFDSFECLFSLSIGSGIRVFFLFLELFNAHIFLCPKHTHFRPFVSQIKFIVVYVSYVLAFNCRTEGSEGALNICDLCFVGSHRE